MSTIKVKRLILFLSILIILMSLLLISPANADGPMTVNYGNFTLYSPYTATHWNDIWDLTKGDLILSYTIDMSGITQPHGLPGNPTEWESYVGPTLKDPSNYPDSYTPWVEVGLRGEDAGDFNPGLFQVYQGNCGGWMVSESDDWVGYWDNNEFKGDGTAIQDLDDKHCLQASGGRSELDYDVLLSNPDVVNSVPNPYPWYPGPLKGAYGSWNNHGLWFDRDGVDQWQANMWGNKGENAGRINTGGVYYIEIIYHAIDANGNGDKTDDGLGVMFASINGVKQGFYTTWFDGPPQYYPCGLSFKGDMKHMQVFAGIFAYDPSGWDYGKVELRNIAVTGYPGTSDPLVADFNFIGHYNFDGSVTVNFMDTSHGGMPPYTYAWDFNEDGITDSTAKNPTYTYSSYGIKTVKLTVTPFRCVSKDITKKINLPPPERGETVVGMNVYPVDKMRILAPWVGTFLGMIILGIVIFKLKIFISK